MRTIPVPDKDKGRERPKGFRRNRVFFVLIQITRQNLAHIGNIARTSCRKDSFAPMFRRVLNNPGFNNTVAKFDRHDGRFRALGRCDPFQILVYLERHNFRYCGPGCPGPGCYWLYLAIIFSHLSAKAGSAWPGLITKTIYRRSVAIRY